MTAYNSSCVEMRSEARDAYIMLHAKIRSEARDGYIGRLFTDIENRNRV